MSKLIKILIITFYCFIGINSFAQPGGVPPGHSNFPDHNTNGKPAQGAEVPIDGGAVALIAGGAIILYRKYIMSQKED